MTTYKFYYLIHELLSLVLIEEKALTAADSFDRLSTRGISLFMLLLLIPAVPVVYFTARYIYNLTIGKSKQRTIIQELRYQAEKLEKEGSISAAAELYLERLNDPETAASLYEKCGDFKRAAYLYETLGMATKAKDLYLRAGDLLSAADKFSAEGSHEEAAKLYYKEGSFLEAARSLEAAGRGMAAVKAYREGRDYLSASRLLAAEGMFTEAAAMFEISLRGKEPKESNIGDFVAYLKLLDKSGETEKAQRIKETIQGVDPSFVDASADGDAPVKGLERTTLADSQAVDSGPIGGPGVGLGDGPIGGLGDGPAGGMDGHMESTSHTGPATKDFSQPPLQSLAPVEEKPSPEEKKSTLGDMVKRDSSMEPRFALRLWVQAIKALQKAYDEENRPFGRVFMENFAFDEHNNVELYSNEPPETYLAPELALGRTDPDARTDIYSLGVMLHEMLTGGLAHLGTRRPGDIIPDIPAWLDDIVMKCIDQDAAKRFRSIDGIFETIKNISQGR